MRKLTELYNELRKVHRRLEADLRGVRDANEFELDAPPGSEYEINTYGRSGNMVSGDGKEIYRGDDDEEVDRSTRDPELLSGRRRTSREYSDRDQIDRCEGSNIAAQRLPVPADALFNLAPNRSPTTNIRINLPSKNASSRGARRRRHPRLEIEDDHSLGDR
ncbi:unnamed protein product [Agarophyton chilense]